MPEKKTFEPGTCSSIFIVVLFFIMFFVLAGISGYLLIENIVPLWIVHLLCLASIGVGAWFKIREVNKQLEREREQKEKEDTR